METEILHMGKKIMEACSGESMAIFRRDYWNGKIMDWSMNNAAFKVDMFRFVDVLPVLKNHNQIAAHLQEYFCKDDKELPSVLKWGLGSVGKTGFTSKIAAMAIRKNITQMAKMFITGSNSKEAFPVLNKLRKQNLAFTVDILGEAAVNEEEAADYQNRYIKLFNELHALSKKWKDHPLLDFDHNGPIPKVNISVKLTSLYSQINVMDFKGTSNVLKQKLRPILHAAKETGSFINIDMEQYKYKDLFLETFLSILEEEEFRTLQNIGIVVQAYLRSACDDLDRITSWCQKNERPLTVRLVKGAYWDYEVIQSQQLGWPCPVFTTKSHSDANFERLTQKLFDHAELTRPAIGSHNIRSLAYSFVLAEKMKLPEKLLEVQMLYGMAEPIKKAVTLMGYRCRDYAPVGELIPGMAYLVRRLLENTANESFLRLKYTTDTSLEDLLKTPQEGPSNLAEGIQFKSPGIENLSEPFKNTPLEDFTIEKARVDYEEALFNVKNNLGQHIPVLIDGKEVETDQKIRSVNPCEPGTIVATTDSVQVADVEKAISLAYNARRSWAKTPIQQRALCLLRAAEIMRKRKFELCAWQVYEVAKTWQEADADICEAVDFFEYYARMAYRLNAGKKLLKVPGEDNQYFYKPKGVGVVIAPWNFPLAIPMGMISAALVMGNPVLFKPAGPSIKIAALGTEILHEAGIPKEVLQFVPGSGPVIGPVLVESPKTSFIIFTGSMDVGTSIVEGAAKKRMGMEGITKVIAEMGGKNALIIDEDADLDEAVLGAIYSGFGFQGQKCSALSRLIVHEAIYDRFMGRFRPALLDIKLGMGTDPGSYLSAVIDEASFNKLSKVIEETRSIAECTTQGKIPNTKGYFIPPTLFEGIPWDSQVATVELFGPIIAAFKVKDLNEAVKLANSVPFALTGGIYSRSPSSIDYIKENLEAGNIYINRGITGAVVDRHPFGGYKLSGVGSKAGGPDYLLQFVDPVTTVENTMRRGFAPEIQM